MREDADQPQMTLQEFCCVVMETANSVYSKVSSPVVVKMLRPRKPLTCHTNISLDRYNICAKLAYGALLANGNMEFPNDEFRSLVTDGLLVTQRGDSFSKVKIC